MWVTALLWLASFAIAAYSYRPQKTQPPPVEGVQTSIAEAGAEIPVLFGTRTIKGVNTVWYGNLKTTPIKK